MRARVFSCFSLAPSNLALNFSDTSDTSTTRWTRCVWRTAVNSRLSWHDEEPDAPIRHQNRAQRRRAVDQSTDRRSRHARVQAGLFLRAIRNETTGLAGGGPHPSAEQAGGTSMARNDTRRFRTQSADRAQLRADAASPAEARSPAEAVPAVWRALANLTVASALVVAVVVSALALVEAAFPSSASKLARHAPDPSGSQSWHARAPTHEPFLPTPTQPEPALFVAD